MVYYSFYNSTRPSSQNAIKLYEVEGTKFKICIMTSNCKLELVLCVSVYLDSKMLLGVEILYQK